MPLSKVEHEIVSRNSEPALDDASPSSEPTSLDDRSGSVTAITPACPEQSSPDSRIEGTIGPAKSEPGVLTSRDQVPYSVFSRKEKGLLVLIVSAAGFFSSVSSNMYFPALNSLAQEYRVSNTLINLTITVYMIFQGLAPSFTGALSDSIGRRPVYVLCFTIYIAANVGLALQRQFAALVVLRCLQSSGSSGTVAIGNAVVSDVADADERGSYIGYVSFGAVIGVSLGATVGGILAQFLGWRSIFWFLVISASVVLALISLFMPETARVVVGNGSVAPPKWNRCLWDLLPSTERRRAAAAAASVPPAGGSAQEKQRRRFVNPLMTLRICADKEAGAVLAASGVTYAGYAALVGALPSRFGALYGYNDLQVGLCYLPIGISAALAAVAVGYAIDWNFARHARRLGLSVEQARQIIRREEDNSGSGGGSDGGKSFPIESARCEVVFPVLTLFCIATVAYGWLLSYRTSVAGPMVMLFLLGFGINGVYTILSVLLLDVYPRAPATATAANNLVRCWLGAGAAVVVIPMMDAMGTGWAFTFIAFLILLMAPVLWVVMRWGPKWRVERIAAEKGREASRARAEVA